MPNLSLPFETERRTDRQTDRQTDMPKHRCAFGTDGLRDRHAEPQMCRLKQTERQIRIHKTNTSTQNKYKYTKQLRVHKTNTSTQNNYECAGSPTHYLCNSMLRPLRESPLA